MIKRAVEALTILAVSSYAIGFIIVNSYLLNYGSAGASLFKVKYISAGLLFLLIAALIAISFSAVFWARTQKEELESNRRRAVLWAPTFALYILYLLLNQITDSEVRSPLEEIQWLRWVPLAVLMMLVAGLVIEESKWEWRGARWLRNNRGVSNLGLASVILITSYSPAVLMVLGLLAYIIFSAMSFAFSEDPVAVRFNDWPIKVIYDLAFFVVLLLISLGFFGQSMYGHIKPQYGGGQPARVRVVLAEEKRVQFMHLGLQQEAETLLGDTQLIDSTDTEFLFLVKKSHGDKGLLLQVNKSLVDVLLYYPILY